ncbi:MAG: hypothetical protein ABSC55_01355 [Syntrophorhabdales bacterium]|jgi:hypothetical protein
MKLRANPSGDFAFNGEILKGRREIMAFLGVSPSAPGTTYAWRCPPLDRRAHNPYLAASGCRHPNINAC